MRIIALFFVNSNFYQWYDLMILQFYILGRISEWKSLSHVWLFVTPWTIESGVCSLSLCQGLFPTQGSNSGLMHCRQTLYQLSHKGSPRILEWVAYPFSSGSSWPRNRTGVSCIADGLFTNWAIREAQITREVPVYFCIQRQQSLRFEFR